MKKLKSLMAATLCSVAAFAQDYPISPVPFTAVKVTPASFWGQRLQASREVTIPLAFSKCESEGRYTNFSNAHQHLLDSTKTFKVGGYSFDDTDVFKTLEGAAYLMQTYPDKRLDAYCDSVIAVVASAQEPDGYLYTARTQNPQHPHDWAGPTRWSKVEDLSHEFYNLGHLAEAAVAHYYATGKRNLLDICIRYADCIAREVGDRPGQACVVPGHQIAEMGLAKLYIATGDKKYLDLAKFFLDKRGYTTIQTEYSQSHLPVLQQDEAVGHAVRAGYMYAGMADVAALTGDTAYIHAIDRLWDNIINKKYYITGGVGATASGEAFGKNYELPNMSAYCETCAAIAQVYLNYRLFLMHGHSKYYDALERTLYNGVISGISIDGGRFFYPNPLQSMGQHQRQAWFGCACCPSNAARFMPSLPQYIYAVKDNRMYVNLYAANEAQMKVNGKRITVAQQTEYPWNGDVTLSIKKGSGQFALHLRIPGWVRGEATPGTLYHYADDKKLSYTVLLNGQPVEADLQDGYFVIDRKWKRGDEVQLHLDMQPRLVKANAKVAADKGRAAIERGPLVYCAEWPDNQCDVLNLLLNQEPQYTLGTKEIQNTKVQTIVTDAQSLGFDERGRLTTQDHRLTLIPYYAWAHRGNGNMAVWLPIDLSATSPTLPPSIASQSKVAASAKLPALSAVNDRLVPADGNDRSVPYTHWWPKNNSTEWLSYTFAKPCTVSTSTVYWFDDSPWGGCTVPQSWKLYYQDADGQWQPVQNTTSYPCVKGEPCTVSFAPVTTAAMKLELQQPKDKSCGVFEWSVK